MSALPYMPLYVSDYLADAAHLTTEEHGAYLLLIMTYWQRGKALPADPERLARIARLSNERWTNVERTLSEFFDVDGEAWRHRRIERELERVNAKSEKAKQAGKASGHARNPKDVQRTLNVRSTDAQRTLNVRSTHAQRTLNHTDTDTDTDTDTEREITESLSEKTEVVGEGVARDALTRAPQPPPNQILPESETTPRPVEPRKPPTPVPKAKAPKKTADAEIIDTLENVFLPETARNVFDHRKSIRAPFTLQAAKIMVEEVSKLDFQHWEGAAKMIIMKGWRGFNHDWYLNAIGNKAQQHSERRQ